MDDYRTLLHRQSGELVARKMELDATRDERAWHAARREQDQPAPPGLYAPRMTPPKPDLAFLIEKHKLLLSAADDREIYALIARHKQELEAQKALPRDAAEASRSAHEEHLQQMEKREAQLRQERDIGLNRGKGRGRF